MIDEIQDEQVASEEGAAEGDRFGETDTSQVDEGSDTTIISEAEHIASGNDHGAEPADDDTIASGVSVPAAVDAVAEGAVVEPVKEGSGEAPKEAPKEATAEGTGEEGETKRKKGKGKAQAEAKGGLPVVDEQRGALPWYVIHTYSGFEQRAKISLEERIKTANLITKFGNIVVPQEKVVELVKGEKKTSNRKVFPGYILVQCQLDEETWHLVKGTPKITGFVGDSINPVPLGKEEVENLLKQMEGGAQRARPSVQFEQGDPVKVVDGPFTDFNGTVDEVKPDKGKLRVLISIFGRNTPVELDFVQVEKV